MQFKTKEYNFWTADFVYPKHCIPSEVIVSENDDSAVISLFCSVVENINEAAQPPE